MNTHGSKPNCTQKNFNTHNIKNSDIETSRERPKWHKSVTGDVVLVSLVELRFFKNSKKSYSTEKLILKLRIRRKLCEILGKNQYYYTRNENVISEL